MSCHANGRVVYKEDQLTELSKNQLMPDEITQNPFAIFSQIKLKKWEQMMSLRERLLLTKCLTTHFQISFLLHVSTALVHPLS